jgi:hypothetical protein
MTQPIEAAAVPGALLQIETMKACSKCGTPKSLGEYHRSSGKKGGDGRMAHCKECHRLMVLAWRQAHLDEARAMTNAYRARHSEALRARSKAKRAAERAEVAAAYAAKLIGLPVSKLPADLAAAKRDQVQIRRMARQLKEVVNEGSKDAC